MNVHDTAAAIVAYALQGGLLLLVGLALPRAVRLRHPETLLVYWRCLLAVVLLLPVAGILWRPPTAVPPLRLEAVSVETVVASALPPSAPGLGLTAVAGLTATVAVLFLVRVATGLVYLRTCRRTARTLSPVPPPLTELQRQLGVDVPLLISDRLGVPFTIGWLRPAVIVPPVFLRLSTDQQEGVACHELLHVRRRDWPLVIAEELLRAIFWFHPAVWLLLPRIALCREQIVDDTTVRLTGKRRQYLEALWQIGCAQRRPAVVAALPLVGRSQLVQRVAWLKEDRTMSKHSAALGVVVSVGVVAVAGFVGASVFSPDLETAATSRAASEAPSSDHHGDRHSGNGEPPDKGSDDLRLADVDRECPGVTHPVVIEKVTPVYPPSAREEHLTGVVVLETVISDVGEVEQVEVLRSPDDRFSEAATAAVAQWRFEPAVCDGEPVAVYYVLTIKFNLE